MGEQPLTDGPDVLNVLVLGVKVDHDFVQVGTVDVQFSKIRGLSEGVKGCDGKR